MRRWTPRKLGLEGTWRGHLFLLSILWHDRLYLSHSLLMDKHLSHLSQCLPCSLCHPPPPCPFFLILHLMSNTDLSCYDFLWTYLPAMGTEDWFFPSPFTNLWLGIFFYPLSVFPLQVTPHYFIQFFLAGHVSDLWSFLLLSFRHPPMGPHWKAMPKLGSKHQLKSHQC